MRLTRPQVGTYTLGNSVGVILCPQRDYKTTAKMNGAFGGSALRVLLAFSHALFPTLVGKYRHPHFANEETETREVR